MGCERFVARAWLGQWASTARLWFGQAGSDGSNLVGMPSDFPQAAAPSAGHSKPVPATFVTVLASALAGGMGWGIRGQYGHETGAMMAGMLIALVLVLRLAPHLPPMASARAVALATVAMGFGGTETYGQTIGLTQDAPLVGNLAAMRWGMLGLALKGGIWIGFFGLFLGMGLGGMRYRGREMLVLMLGIIACHHLGVGWMNEPFDPDHRLLPRIYFSDDWRWEPGSDLKPRREVWGGLLLAFGAAWAWCAGARRDVLAGRLALWGFLGGAVGFPLGQSLQAAHAWHPEWFAGGLWTGLAPHMNWWNWMETLFGLSFAAVLAGGLVRNRSLIAGPRGAESVDRPWLETGLLGLHLGLLAASEWGNFPAIRRWYDPGFHLGFIPMLAVATGRRWAAWLPTVVTLVPIAGKTFGILLRQQAPASAASLPIVAIGCGILPLAWGVIEASRWIGVIRRGTGGEQALRRVLAGSAWVCFWLNFAVFGFPWPWIPWTARTPNALFFAGALAAITALGFGIAGRGVWRHPSPTPSVPPPAGPLPAQ